MVICYDLTSTIIYWDQAVDVLTRGNFQGPVFSRSFIKRSRHFSRVGSSSLEKS